MAVDEKRKPRAIKLVIAYGASKPFGAGR